MGTRLRADVTDNLTLIGGVFDGDAAGPGPHDPQLRDRYGVNFRVNDPPLVLAEAQFLWNAKKGDPGLDGKFKLGGWRHFGTFTDELFTLPVSRSPTRRPAEFLPTCRAISASTPCLSRRSIASGRTTTGA
jgi:hypothetical protein